MYIKEYQQQQKSKNKKKPESLVDNCLKPETVDQILDGITRSKKKINKEARDCGGQLCRYWIGSQDH